MKSPTYAVLVRYTMEDGSIEYQKRDDLIFDEDTFAVFAFEKTLKVKNVKITIIPHGKFKKP